MYRPEENLRRDPRSRQQRGRREEEWLPQSYHIGAEAETRERRHTTNGRDEATTKKRHQHQYPDANNTTREETDAMN